MSTFCEIKPYINKLPISIGHKNYINDKHNEVVVALKNTKFFELKEGKLYAFKDQYDKSFAAITKINKKFGSKVAALINDEVGGTRLVQINAISLGMNYVEPTGERDIKFFRGDRSLYNQEQTEDKELKVQSTEIDSIIEDINNIPEEETKFDEKGQGLLFGNLQDLAESNRIAVGDIKVENRKIVGFERKPNPYLRDYNTDLTEVQAKKLFEKPKKSVKDYEKLAVYFANMFVSEIIDKDVYLRTGYARLDSIVREDVKPKILITDTNRKENPFYQYNNTIIVGVYQLQQLIQNNNYKDYEKFQKLIQSVAQEEAIHLFAEYLFNKETVDNIYAEMSKKDIQKIKDTYNNQNLLKDAIVHEYVRMAVQQHVFNSTTEQEKVKLTNSVLEFISDMIDQIRQFLKEIIGQDITQKAIQDVIDFTKGNFSEELDSRIINKIFEQGSILESNLQNIEFNTSQVEDSSLNQTIKPGVEELFNSNPGLANSVYSKLLTNSGISAENLLSLLLKDNLIEKQCS